MQGKRTLELHDKIVETLKKDMEEKRATIASIVNAEDYEKLSTVTFGLTATDVKRKLESSLGAIVWPTLMRELGRLEREKAARRIVEKGVLYVPFEERVKSKLEAFADSIVETSRKRLGAEQEKLAGENQRLARNYAELLKAYNGLQEETIVLRKRQESKILGTVTGKQTG